jgi:hypothetical protein
MLHKNVPVLENHILHNWEVADAAALAALVLSSADRGKLAWQRDTNVFLFLANDIGPVWLPCLGVKGDKGLTGDPGLAGKSILNGIVAPVAGIGADGDFYLDTVLMKLYGPKAAGAWPAGIIMKGTNGTNGTNAIKVLPVACSDEITALTVGTGKVTFRMPYAIRITGIRASLTTAQAAGASLLTIDIKADGVSILSPKLTIDNTEKTSTTATTPYSITGTDIIDDAEISIDITAIGDGSAKGLKVYLIGT